MFVLAGTLAGLLTWFVSDLSGLIRLPDDVGRQSARDVLQQQIVGMAFGAFVGVLLGVADTLASGVARAWPKVVGVGLGIGLVAGLIGLSLGAKVFGALYQPDASNPLVFTGNVFARAIGWSFIGALAGTADGFRKSSVRVGRNGLIGGLIGGLLGGTIFEIVPYILLGLPRPGVVSRLLGFLITGALIGLFVALVQQLLKEAWIKVVVGRNETKEFLVEKTETTIGRSEMSDVSLFGDPAIAPTHAVVRALPGGRFALRDASSGEAGTIVNGARVVDETPLKNGDTIQIGGRTLVFHERFTKSRTPAANKDVAAAPKAAQGTAIAGPPSLANGLAPPDLFPSAGRTTRFVAANGPHAGASFVLAGGTSVIGRDGGAEIALPGDVKTSRVHARLRRDASNNAVLIEDAGSTNGTFVNGQRVHTATPLAPGDTIVVGQTSLRFEG